MYGGFAVTAAVIVSLYFLYSIYMRLRDRWLGLPPCPFFTLPIFGSLCLFLHFKNFHEKTISWAEKYGPVFLVYAGPFRMIPVIGYEAAKEVLVTHSVTFADRPHFAQGIINKFNKDKLGIIEGLYNAVWKEQRHFSHTSLRTFGFGKASYQDTIVVHARRLMNAIHQTDGQSLDVSSAITNAVSNVICSVIFGKNYEFDDEEFNFIIKSVNDIFELGAQAPLFLLELREKLGNKVMKALKEADTNISDFIKKECVYHEETMDADAPRDFIDAYLAQMRRMEAQEHRDEISLGYNQRQLNAIILDLFLAGTETTTSTLRFAILFMLHYPNVQKKVAQELLEVVGEDNIAEWKHRSNLPYTEATMMEIQRHKTVASFTIPHTAVEDSTLYGYHIPKHYTCLAVNIHSVLMDKTHWKEPHEFLPERFIDGDGKVQKPEAWIPFSAGRRVCMGEQLARMELFIFFSNLVHAFKLEVPPKEKLITLESKFGNTIQPYPYNICARPRYTTSCKF